MITDPYMAMMEFVRRQLVAGGLPAERIFAEPKTVARDPNSRETAGKTPRSSPSRFGFFGPMERNP